MHHMALRILLLPLVGLPHFALAPGIKPFTHVL